MKRFVIFFIINCLFVAFSGCSSLSDGTKSHAPVLSLLPILTIQPMATIKQEPSPTLAVMPSPVVNSSPTAMPPNVYASKKFGFSFTVPESWVGKYRVEEGDDYLTVYFNPEETVDEFVNSELFSIATKAYSDVKGFVEDCHFEINGVVYIWGSIYINYTESDPEYNTFLAWQKDIPGVFQSIRSLSGQAPENVKKIWIEVIPEKQIYVSTSLGISFTLPKEWIGSCSVVEEKDSLAVYFKPKNPIVEDLGNGWLFMIEKMTDEYDESQNPCEYMRVKVNGITYICNTPTDVAYVGEGKELDRYCAMEEEVGNIFKTIQAAD